MTFVETIVPAHVSATISAAVVVTNTILVLSSIVLIA